MKNISILALGALFVFSFNGTSTFAAEDDAVATINNKKITLQEFNQKYEEVKKQTINPPTKDEFLEDIIRYKVGLEEAERKNLRNDPIVVDRIQQEMYKALLEKEIGEKVQKISVTEEEMIAWYKSNPELRSAHILIEFKPDANAEEKLAAKKRADEIFDEVKKSKRPFEELVNLYSDDALSKKNGGDVGFQSRLTLVPSYYNVLAKMKEGEIRGLIETQYGFHIVKMTGKQTYANANKRQIRAAVFDEKRKKVFDEYFNKLKKNYTIKENKKLIK